MPQSVWYFAIGDQEKGPVSESQIKMLIGTGNLNRDDLVWREGMDDWKPASEVPGLFDKSSPAASAEKMAAKPKAEPLPNKKAKTRDDKPAAAATQSAPQPASNSGSKNSFALSTPKLAFDVTEFSKLLGHPLLIVGLLTALFARGCDSLAERYADRVVARSQTAELEFDQQWNARLQKVKDQPAELRELQREMQTQRTELQNGKWKTLKGAAATADENNKMWAFWRQMMFIAGTFALVLGLLSVAHHGDGPQRWMAMATLAIIVFSLYVSTSSWF